LTGAERKAVKTTAFDLQLNSAAPGLRFHRLDRARDPNFWSVRVNDDVRLIVHGTATGLLLCYVGHHEAAYAWAERRKIERHPVTGAAQLVELPERVAIPAVRAPAISPAPDEALLGYGVPPEWIEAVGRADEDALFDLLGHLPQEAAEALLNLATGTTPVTLSPAPVEVDSFAHPRCATPVPRSDQPRGVGASARLSVGEVGGLPASGAAPPRRAELQRPGAHIGFSGHRQDDRGAALRRLAGATPPRFVGAADRVLEAAGQRATCFTSPAPAPAITCW
jgi:hypothetical protein